LASLATSEITVVPNFHDESNTDTAAMTSLKARLDGVKTLGLVRVSPEEYMVIYDGKLFYCKGWILTINSWGKKIAYGCYITQFGLPSRECRYIKWETKANSYAYRDASGHILLISSEFIEIRNVTTG
jgi:RHO1 GDP-GTP exchange protein 1/2